MRRIQKKATRQPFNDAFTLLCRKELGERCEKEWKFHPVRKWRFDYSIPKYKIAIEIDGGVWTYGRHNRSAGYLADMEKFNAAAALGWVVLKFTPQQQYTRKTLEIIRQTIKTIRDERNLEANQKL